MLTKYVQRLLRKYSTQVKFPKYKFNEHTLYIAFINAMLTPNTIYNKQFNEMIITADAKEFLKEFVHREEYVDCFLTAFSKYGYNVHFYPNNEKNEVYKRKVLRSVKEKAKIERFVFVEKYNYFLKKDKERDLFKKKLLEAFVMHSERGGYEESFDLKKELNEYENNNNNNNDVNNNIVNDNDGDNGVNDSQIYKENEEEDKEGEVTQRNEIDYMFCINRNKHSKSFDNIECLALYLTELENKRKEKQTTYTNNNNNNTNSNNNHNTYETKHNNFPMKTFQNTPTINKLNLHLNNINTPLSLSNTHSNFNTSSITTNDFLSFTKNIHNQQRRVSRRDSLVKRIEKINIIIPSILETQINITEPNQHVASITNQSTSIKDKLKSKPISLHHHHNHKKTLIKFNNNNNHKGKYLSTGQFLLKLKLKEKTQHEKQNQLYRELVTHSPYYKNLKMKGIKLPIVANQTTTSNARLYGNRGSYNYNTVINTVGNYQRLGNSIASKVFVNLNKPYRSSVKAFVNKSSSYSNKSKNKNNNNNNTSHSMSYLIQQNRNMKNNNSNSNNANTHVGVDCRWQRNDGNNNVNKYNRKSKSKEMVGIYKSKKKCSDSDSNIIIIKNININE